MFASETAEALYKQFSKRPNKNRPLIVGLDGLGGAGKTTFVKKVNQELKDYNCTVNVIHLDDHIVEKNKRYHTGYDEWYEYYYLQWDIDGLLNTLLKPLYNSKHMHLSFYDKSTDSIFNRQVDVLADSIVLIEGVFLQRKEWKNFFDYVIFLNCPFELRRERALNRDAYIGDYQDRLQKYTERYWLGEKHYLATIKPCTIADLVINVI